VTRTAKIAIRRCISEYWRGVSRAQFLINRVPWPDNFRPQGPIGLSRNGTGFISIGHCVTIVSTNRFNRAGINHPTQLVAGNDATLKIGNHVGISGATIFCSNSITIGDHVLVGANASIYDTDFHPLGPNARRNDAKATTAPVTIEDDVWLGASSIVLKGVTIGQGSVIGAGSVVTHDIPPFTLAGGVPAKPIKQIDPKS